MYNLWKTATSLSVRPSDLVGIPTTVDRELERFEFDNAVSFVGRYLDSKLEEYLPDSVKRRYTSLQAVLDDNDRQMKAIGERRKKKLELKHPKPPTPHDPNVKPKVVKMRLRH